MKIILFILLVFTLLTVDHPKVNEVRSYLFTKFDQVVKQQMPKHQLSELVEEDVKKMFDHFKEQEEQYILEITSSSDSVMEFYQEYCKGFKFNPKLSKHNLSEVCRSIEKQLSELEIEVLKRI